MTRLPLTHVFAAVSLLATAASLDAQSFTTFGTGCPGSGGLVPAIGNTGLPVLGTKFQLDLAKAAPSSSALLVLGVTQMSLNLGFLGAPACNLLASPDLVLPLVTGGAGTAAAPFFIPADPAFGGAVVFAQWIVLDPGAPNQAGVALSEGGRVLIDNLPPMSIGSIFVVGNGQVGTIVTARMRNVGTTNPDDLCFRVMGGNPTSVQVTALLRVTGIVPDPMTGDDIVTARLATVPEQVGVPFPHWTIGAMRGTGGKPSVPASGVLGTSAAPWGWSGFGLTGNGNMGPSPFVPVPETVAQKTIPFVYDAGTKSLVADVPPYPWGNGGLYPKNTKVTSDLHGDVDCGGPSSRHLDDFLEGVAVVVDNVSAQQIADDHAPQIQAVFDQTYGVGKVVVSHEAGARMRVKAAGGCDFMNGSGSIVITK